MFFVRYSIKMKRLEQFALIFLQNYNKKNLKLRLDKLINNVTFKVFKIKNDIQFKGARQPFYSSSLLAFRFMLR